MHASQFGCKNRTRPLQLGSVFEVRQDRAGEAFVHFGPDRMGASLDEPASPKEMNAIQQPLPKVFRPMPDEVFNATPPHLRVRYMVKRILNQARRANPDKKKVRVRTFKWWHWRCLLRFKRRLTVVDYV